MPSSNKSNPKGVPGSRVSGNSKVKHYDTSTNGPAKINPNVKPGKGPKPKP